MADTLKQNPPQSADPWAAFEPVAPEPKDPWSGFEEVKAAAPAATFDERSGNGPMARAPDAPGVMEDVAKTVPSALARGVAGIAGIPGIVSQGADWLANQSAGRVENLIRGKGFVAPTDEERAARAKEVSDLRSQSAAGSLAQAIDAGTILSPTSIDNAIESVTGPLYRPKTTPGRYIGAVAEMAPGALFGGGSTWERILSTIGAGFGSEGLYDATKGTWAEPYAKLIGGIGGGIVGSAVPTLGTAAAAATRNASRAVTDPLTKSGQARIAARELENRAENPQAFREALEQPSGLVPGSMPTTFQKTGDLGIGAAEREAATLDPAAFNARRAEQNAARVEAMRGVQPEGSAVDVASSLRTQLRDLDDVTAAIEARYADVARKSAADIPTPGRPDEIGSAMRSSLESANAAAKAQERSLWKAVDPDNTLALDVSPLRSAAQDIERSLGQSAKPIAGEERAILDVVNGYKPVMPFNEMTDLRSRVSTAMREELRSAGATPVYARLSNLRGAIEDTINTAVERKAAQEADAVATGAMRSEDTIAENLRRWQDEWRNSRAAATGTSDSSGAPGYGGSRASTLPGVGGTESAAGIGSGGSARNPSVQGQPLVPNLDEAAAERLKAASAATKERAQTFKQGPVGESLRSAGMSGDYRVMDAAVPAKFFRPGPEGFERVNAYRDAVKNDAEAVANLANAAALSLRAKAIGADGAIDPAKFAKWQADYAPALKAMPEVEKRFSNAAKASEMVAEAAADRKQALDAFQVGTAGKLLGMTDPEDVVKTVGAIFGQKDAVRQMRDLASRVRHDPEAMNGLRRAVAEYIDKKFLSNTEAATSGKDLISANAFQTFVKQNRGTLNQVFEQKEVQLLDAIAADIKRANRSIVATKLPGQSNTAQDVIAHVTKGGHGESLLSRLAGLSKVTGPVAGAVAGFYAAGAPGLVLGLGAGTYNAMRNAGMSKVNDLIKEALLNPDIARTLLMKAPIKPDRGSAMALRRQLERIAVFGGIGASNGEERRRYKSGGRVEPTEAQKGAGNYPKERISFQGLPISIETRKGQERSGASASGKRWTVKMPADYGYIRRTEGADGDHVDAYIGPDKTAPMAWVVDQIDPKTKAFDEHKLMLGFSSKGHAIQTYRAGFSDGSGGKRMGAITPISMSALKSWLAGGKTGEPVGLA